MIRWGMSGAFAVLAGALLAGLYACVCAPAAKAALPQFGIAKFAMSATNEHGEPYTQAAGHPYELTTTIDFDTEEIKLGKESRTVPVQDPKDIVVDLPPGLLGDPQTAPQCPLSIFDSTGSEGCPPSTQVGTVSVSKLKSTFVGEVYNLVPTAGSPAEFGLTTPVGINFLFTTGVRPGEAYGLTVRTAGVPLDAVRAISFSLWGVPADPRHDGQRGQTCYIEPEEEPECSGGGHASGDPLRPFLTMPGNCSAGPLTATLSTDSWESPGHLNADSTPSLGDPNWKTERVTLPAVTGCDRLAFEPSLEVLPDSTQADRPVGLEVNLQMPQASSAGLPATPQLRDATVTLPQGMSISPGAAAGLAGCTPEAIDLTGMEKGVDEVGHVARGHCPQSSQIGTAKLETPLSASPLEGRIYLAQPQCGAGGQSPCAPADAEAGRMLGLYLEAEGAGIDVKLPGEVEVGGHGPHSVDSGLLPGQVRVRFDEAPQLPLSGIRLVITGGPRALLANSQTCGEARTTGELTPWSAPESGPAVTPSSFYQVTGCVGDLPFDPGFIAGTVTPIAGEYSPYTLTFSRNDGEQDLGAIEVRNPPGLLAEISEVPLCGEPQAAQGTCPPTSRVGTMAGAAGAGSQPLWLSGPVYLTGPYRGAPFGLSIVVPVQAGPFNLGEEVVRAAIHIDPRTAALTIASDPLPQSRDGIPLRLQTINVTVDRPRFMFNPTSCRALDVQAQLTGEHPLGSGEAPRSAQVSSPFAVAGCRNMPFKPSLSASTRGRASIRGDGASLTFRVVQRSGEANIKSVRVSLPKKLPSRLTTLQRACPEAMFNANPASCPAASDIGTAVAHTVVLPVALEGPAYFVSHGGAKYPELIVVLQGDGVTIDLAGETQIDLKTGITSSTFALVPDAPISSFALKLPERSNSALASPSGNLCGKRLAMPTTIIAQNGAQIKRSVKVFVSGCPKHRKVKHTRRARRRGRGRG
jgi:hypothetical protein